MLENIIYAIIAIAIFIPLVAFAFIIAHIQSQKEIENELENMGSPSNLMVPSFFNENQKTLNPEVIEPEIYDFLKGKKPKFSKEDFESWFKSQKARHKDHDDVQALAMYKPKEPAND